MMLDAVQDTYDHLVFFAEEYLVDKTRTILKSDLFDLSEWSGKVSVRTTILELCRRRGFEPDFIENDEPRTAFNCAEMGLQAGIVNEVSAEKLLRSFPNVCIVPFSEPEMNWNVYLIKKKGAALTSVAKALEASLLKKAREI